MAISVLGSLEPEAQTRGTRRSPNQDPENRSVALRLKLFVVVLMDQLKARWKECERLVERRKKREGGEFVLCVLVSSQALLEEAKLKTRRSGWPGG